jgi:hypothetical protein
MFRDRLVTLFSIALVALVLAPLLTARVVAPESDAAARWQAVRMADDWAIILDTANGSLSLVGRNDAFTGSAGFTRSMLDLPVPLDDTTDPDGSKRAKFFDQWNEDACSKGFRRFQEDQAKADSKSGAGK